MILLNKYPPYTVLHFKHILYLKSNINVRILIAFEVSGVRPNLKTFRERKWKKQTLLEKVV